MAVSVEQQTPVTMSQGEVLDDMIETVMADEMMTEHFVSAYVLGRNAALASRWETPHQVMDDIKELSVVGPEQKIAGLLGILSGMKERKGTK